MSGAYGSVSVLAILTFTVSVVVAAQFRTHGITVERVATGYAFTEGPAPDGKGGIWFSDIDNTDIYRFDIATGVTTLQNGESGGSNGLVFDDQGRLLAAEHSTQRVTRTDGDTIEVLADSWNGLSLNSPNDMVVDKQGGIYFTDPAYANNVQPEAVYYIAPNGELSQVITGLSRPNGIALSPDDGVLYVAEPKSLPWPNKSNMKICQFDLASPGSPSNKRVFANSFADGLTVDAYGNVFAATYAGFTAWTPSGQKIFSRSFPNATTNVAFANPAGTYPNTLYVTAGGSLYRTELLPVPEPACWPLLMWILVLAKLRGCPQPSRHMSAMRDELSSASVGEELALHCIDLV
ncbi:MAG: SMP-30/gluconolactonase/LRE family protein [Pirellulaceae bacterium]